MRRTSRSKPPPTPKPLFYEEYLSRRLGDGFGDDVILGTAEDAAEYGFDLTSLRDEGYIIRTLGNDTVIFGKTEDGLDRGVRYYANYCADVDEVNVTYGEGMRVKKIEIAGRDISEYKIYLFPGADQCHTLCRRGASALYRKSLRRAS